MTNRTDTHSCRSFLLQAVYRALIAVIFFAWSFTIQAAEKSAPPTPDPLLSDLKTTVEVAWNSYWEDGKQAPPALDISVLFRGKAAAQASEFGELHLDSVLDEHGKSYRWTCDSFPFDAKYMTPVSHANSDSDDAFRLKLRIVNRPPIQTIRELRGSLALKTDGTFEPLLIDGVFKKLVDPTEENADPDDWGTVVRDKRLDSLGVKLSVARRPIPKWSDSKTFKDCIHVNVKSDSLPVVDCEIVDAKGKPIKTEDTGSCGKTISLDCLATVRVPSDARLRLTFHKNARKVRVPFVLTDIAVPKIDANQFGMDVPASADGAFVEAEALSPNDPIVTGLHWRVETKWATWMRDEWPPRLVVTFQAKGKTVRSISASGEMDVESALTDSGRSLFVPCETEMKARFKDANPFQIEAWISDLPPMSKIRELRGSIALQVAGSTEPVVVKDFLKRVTKESLLDDPALKALGIVAKIEHRKNGDKDYADFQAIRIGNQPPSTAEAVKIDLKWKQNAVVSCELCDPTTGEPLKTDSSGTSNPTLRSVGLFYSFKDPLPPKVELRFRVQKNTRKVRVPFAFKDVEVPKMPSKEEASRGVLVTPAQKVAPETENNGDEK